MSLTTAPGSTGSRFIIDRPVFYSSAGILLALVVVTVAFPTVSASVFQSIQGGIVRYGSWYYVLVVAIVLLSVLFFAFSRFGDIKLGPDHSEPAYSAPSWFSMLFSAGMGIGLMFFGVSEPVMHFLEPPQGAPGTVTAAREAMRLTFFHWGLHAWAIYAIVALILGYFAYRHGLPLTLRSALYPLIGDRIYGPWGAVVDSFAIIATICGVATSLGLGALQINSGLNYLVGIPINLVAQVVIIVVTMVLATVSLVMGLDAGIKRLSEINISLAFLLLIGVLITGPTVLVLTAFTQNLGSYLAEIVAKTFNLYAYNPTDWLGGWTIFYWGWWLSWSPFVGLFIARISRGRTIREFVLGAMLVPCGFTLLWMSVFGNSAIDLILNQGQTIFGAAVQENEAVALFQFFELQTATQLLSWLAIFMVIVFFVTSADSGAMVLNMLSAHGRDDTPRTQRIFWTGLITLITIALLVSGGLESLQTAAIASALPFSFVLLWAILGFGKALRVDSVKREIQNTTVSPPLGGADNHWRRRLQCLLQYPDRNQVLRFQKTVVLPVLREFADELERGGVRAEVVDTIDSDGRLQIEITHGDAYDFLYEIHCRAHPRPDRESGNGARDKVDAEKVYYRAEVHLREGGQGYDIMGWSPDQVVANLLSQYENHLQFLQTC